MSVRHKPSLCHVLFTRGDTKSKDLLVNLMVLANLVIYNTWKEDLARGTQVGVGLLFCHSSGHISKPFHWLVCTGSLGSFRGQ